MGILVTYYIKYLEFFSISLSLLSVDAIEYYSSEYFKNANINFKTKVMTKAEKAILRDEAKEMFYHAFNCYMDKAYPADELMPLSCKGRWRNTEPSRGDIDEALGNFSLTLVDSLDTLVILGDLDEFEKGVKLVIRDVSFDTDVVVSVFETNIRMVGGLLSAHLLTEHMNQMYGVMKWYRGELLGMAQDLATRLLPAFNTSTGVPYPKVNLKYGLNSPKLQSSRDTCTACAGTIVLEFASLSRLTGEPVFEEKARKAMDYLWSQRHRGSDLVGTILNIHNGDWVRRDSGIGAGIDSYYEYLLKGYVLLGDDSYLNRFNKHYASVMKYVSQGPMFLDVHMHRPQTMSRNYMDSLLAFWPGLQVLKGDIKPAIETHEMLYQVIQRHKFLPEAFTSDFQVYWGQHPLRPEFVESTYLLYQATNDPHYLEVGEKVLRSLQKHTWVPCGYAAVKDVRTGDLDDRMDSFVLAETFKYLYLLFAEKEELLLDLNEFVFTTEAHLLPLSLARLSNLTAVPMSDEAKEPPLDSAVEYAKSCPNIHYLLPSRTLFAENIRNRLKNYVNNVCPPRKSVQRKLFASEFQAGNSVHMKIIKNMGITIMSIPDGRVQLLHSVSNAQSPDDAEEGVLFMQEMIELSKRQQDLPENPSRAVSFVRPGVLSESDVDALEDEEIVVREPGAGNAIAPADVVVIIAGPAQFGLQLEKDVKVVGHVIRADPWSACPPLADGSELKDRIVIMERGNCMFIEKARHIESFGAIGGIVVDNTPRTAAATSPMFAMSGDSVDNVTIPMVFLFSDDARRLLEAVDEDPDLLVTLSDYNTELSKSFGKGSYSIADDEIIAEKFPFETEGKKWQDTISYKTLSKHMDSGDESWKSLSILRTTTKASTWIEAATAYIESTDKETRKKARALVSMLLKDAIRKSESGLLRDLLVDRYLQFQNVMKRVLWEGENKYWSAFDESFEKIRSILTEEMKIVGKFFTEEARMSLVEEQMLAFIMQITQDDEKPLEQRVKGDQGNEENKETQNDFNSSSLKSNNLRGSPAVSEESVKYTDKPKDIEAEDSGYESDQVKDEL